MNNNEYPLFSYTDIHSHTPDPRSVLSVDITETLPQPVPSQAITIGVHPWNAHKEVDWQMFENLLDNESVVGVGEAGLDALRGPSLEVQMPVFRQQIELAEKHRLPLVIHSVRTNHLILALMKEYKPTVPWIIHGYRGNLVQARQLVKAGLHLSLSHEPDKRWIDELGADRLHRETDSMPAQ